MSVYGWVCVKRNHSVAEGIMQIFPRTCVEADGTSAVLSPFHAVIVINYSIWYKPMVYTGRTHFGNRGNADVRVERRLAPSGGDDKLSCG